MPSSVPLPSQTPRFHYAPWISGAITLACAAAFFSDPRAGWHSFAAKILWPLTRLLGIMTLSLSISALVEGMGWATAVARFARPLMRVGRLGDWTGTAFTTAFVSGVAASTLLGSAFEDGRITRRELFLAVLLNGSLPSFIMHLPVTAAILASLVGPAGLIYVGLTFLAAALRAFAVLLAGRSFLRREAASGLAPAPSGAGDAQDRKAKVLALFRRYLSERLVRIALFTIPIYLFVALLHQWGVFNWLEARSSTLVVSRVIPVQGLSVVIFSIVAEFTAGAAAAGAMLSAGVLTIKQTVIALLLGSILATPVRSLRHQLPQYLGIFQPAMGTKLLLAGQTLRIASVAIVGILFYAFYP